MKKLEYQEELAILRKMSLTVAKFLGDMNLKEYLGSQSFYNNLVKLSSINSEYTKFKNK